MICVSGGIAMTMIAVSEFKAKCISVLDRANADGEAVLITRRGRPLARVVPAAEPLHKTRRLGGLAGEARQKGNIVKGGFAADWEALR
jgi:prevent-host-death family protein